MNLKNNIHSLRIYFIIFLFITLSPLTIPGNNGDGELSLDRWWRRNGYPNGRPTSVSIQDDYAMLLIRLPHCLQVAAATLRENDAEKRASYRLQLASQFSLHVMACIDIRDRQNKPGEMPITGDPKHIQSMMSNSLNLAGFDLSLTSEDEVKSHIESMTQSELIGSLLVLNASLIESYHNAYGLYPKKK